MRLVRHARIVENIPAGPERFGLPRRHVVRFGADGGACNSAVHNKDVCGCASSGDYYYYYYYYYAFPQNYDSTGNANGHYEVTVLYKANSNKYRGSPWPRFQFPHASEIKRITMLNPQGYQQQSTRSHLPCPSSMPPPSDEDPAPHPRQSHKGSLLDINALLCIVQ